MSWSGQSWGPEQPRLVADLTGDGKADIVGFGVDGVWASLSNGDGTFAPPNMVVYGFNFDTGWRTENHVRFLADLCGDGRADIVGFGDDGVWTARNNGDGTFQAPKFVLMDLGYNQAWRVDKHPRFACDLTGDGKADLIGFGDNGVHIALGNGDGTFQPSQPVLAEFNQAQGWQAAKHLRITGDLNGDRKRRHRRLRRRGRLYRHQQRGRHLPPRQLRARRLRLPGRAGRAVDHHRLPHLDDDLNSDSLLHVFVKNRASDSSDSAGSSTYVANMQDYRTTTPTGSPRTPTSAAPSTRARGGGSATTPRTGSTSSCGQSRSRSRSSCSPR